MGATRDLKYHSTNSCIGISRPPIGEVVAKNAKLVSLAFFIGFLANLASWRLKLPFIVDKICFLSGAFFRGEGQLSGAQHAEQVSHDFDRTCYDHDDEHHRDDPMENSCNHSFRV